MNKGGAIPQGLSPKKSEKCPVCGMFVYKYPKWAAYIFYGPAGEQKRLVFDGVKDMMKFYLDPVRWGYDTNIKQHISRMAVQDYYTLKFIPAEAAWYVMGSDVYGPMGNELIPFASKEAAERFMKDHHGKRILRFDEIDERVVQKLDE
jgi:nitrous oxide reductase accessory protein NosL